MLTLGCGKFRIIDHDYGSVGGLPRLLDMGQCNDAYSAIRVAQALTGAFGVGIHDLPLSLVLSWYEQKAVCVLLFPRPALHQRARDHDLGRQVKGFALFLRL